MKGSNLLSDEPVEGVRRITFNRPDSLNAWTFPMFDQLLEELEELRENSSVRVVILTGKGRGFSSGFDRNSSGIDDVKWINHENGQIQKSVASLQRVSRIVPTLRSMPQVVIAAVNGIVAGIGYPIVLGSDMAIAAESASFTNGFRYVGAGGTEGGLSYLLPRTVGLQRSAELLLTSRRIRAVEAAAIGLVLRSVPDIDLESEVIGLCRDVMEMSPFGVAQTKAALWSNVQSSAFSVAVELETMGQILATRTEDSVEVKAAIAEKRPAVFKNR